MTFSVSTRRSFNTAALVGVALTAAIALATPSVGHAANVDWNFYTDTPTKPTGLGTTFSQAGSVFWTAGGFTVGTSAFKNTTTVTSVDRESGRTNNPFTTSGDGGIQAGPDASTLTEITTPELLVIDLNNNSGSGSPAGTNGPNHPGWTLVSLTLSSIDPSEGFVVYGCKTLTFGCVSASSYDLTKATLLAQFTKPPLDGSDPANTGPAPVSSTAQPNTFTISLTGNDAGGNSINNTYEYLFVTSTNATSSPLVAQLRGQTAVPEPGTLATLGIALLGLGYARRRRASAA